MLSIADLHPLERQCSPRGLALATLEGLRGVARYDPDPEIRAEAIRGVDVLSHLDPKRVCAACRAILGPSLADADSHSICSTCSRELYPDYQED